MDILRFFKNSHLTLSYIKPEQDVLTPIAAITVSNLILTLSQSFIWHKNKDENENENENEKSPPHDQTWSRMISAALTVVQLYRVYFGTNLETKLKSTLYLKLKRALFSNQTQSNINIIYPKNDINQVVEKDINGLSNYLAEFLFLPSDLISTFSAIHQLCRKDNLYSGSVFFVLKILFLLIQFNIENPIEKTRRKQQKIKDNLEKHAYFTSSNALGLSATHSFKRVLQEFNKAMSDEQEESSRFYRLQVIRAFASHFETIFTIGFFSLFRPNFPLGFFDLHENIKIFSDLLKKIGYTSLFLENAAGGSKTSDGTSAESERYYNLYYASKILWALSNSVAIDAVLSNICVKGPSKSITVSEKAERISNLIKSIQEWQAYCKSDKYMMNIVYDPKASQEIIIKGLTVSKPPKNPDSYKIVDRKEQALQDPNSILVKDVRIRLPLTDRENHGKYYRLRGPSGCGKSTIVNALLGMCPFAECEKVVFPCKKEEIAFIPQKVIMPIESTLLEAICYPDIIPQNSLQNTTLRKKAITFMKYLGLQDFTDRLDHYDENWIQRISQGQAQRFALIRILLKNPEPKILFMDEGTSGVDPETTKKMLTLFRKKLSKTTLVFITHDTNYSEVLNIDNLVIDTEKKALLYNRERPSSIKRVESAPSTLTLKRCAVN